MKDWKEECGLFGIWNDKGASQMTYLGLYAQQHRGQEACGIVSYDEENESFQIQKDFGYVNEVFNQKKIDPLKGKSSIGHVRYSTSGKKQASLAEIQPLSADTYLNRFYFAHNGNILNAKSLKDSLKERGSIFHGDSDSEILAHLIAHSPEDSFEKRLKKALSFLKGAYCFLILTKDKLFAIRDPLGMRPLSLGMKKNSKGEDSYVFASETCAFDLVGAKFVREISPGEIFSISKKGEHSEIFKKEQTKKAHCIFEHVYFSRPDSYVFGSEVYKVRKKMGMMLAKESYVEADMVIPVPDSGILSALGFSLESKIPFEMGIVRNHYIGRTFIEPQSSLRNFMVKVKLNPQTSLLKDKTVIVVDDSLVRGTTCRELIMLLRQKGAKKVHFRVSSPPIISPCYYGIDTPTKKELIASTNSIDKIKEFIQADSLSYLSLEGLKACVKNEKDYCDACFTDKHPF